MPVLRLFAAAREVAGSGSVEVDGATVGEVLGVALDRFGPRFGEVLGTSAVWLNGEPTDRTAVVSATDEVAVLPPVSGG